MKTAFPKIKKLSTSLMTREKLFLFQRISYLLSHQKPLESS